MRKKKKTAVKDRISNTVLSLFREKSISDIRISEVTERAMVARASFYRNFNNFDEVLDYIAEGYVMDFSEAYLPLLINGDYDSWYCHVKKVLTKMYEKKETFNDLLSVNLRIVFHKFEQKIVNVPDHLWSTNPMKKYEHIAKISAFYAVCEDWIRCGTKESIDDMTSFLVNNVLMASKVA